MTRCQSTIDSPDSVKRVRPPKMTIPNTRPVHVQSQTFTAVGTGGGETLLVLVEVAVEFGVEFEVEEELTPSVVFV